MCESSYACAKTSRVKITHAQCFSQNINKDAIKERGIFFVIPRKAPFSSQLFLESPQRRKTVVKMQHLATALVLWICITLAACRPHILQKRATVAETVGDLTAEEAGIINEEGELLTQINVDS